MNNQFQNNKTQSYNKLIIVGVLTSIMLLLGFILFFTANSTLLTLFCKSSRVIAWVMLIRIFLILSFLNIIISIIALMQIKKRMQQGRFMGIIILALGFFFLIFSLFLAFYLSSMGFNLITIVFKIISFK